MSARPECSRGVPVRELARTAPDVLAHGWVIRGPATVLSRDGRHRLVRWWCGHEPFGGRPWGPLWDNDEDILVWGDALWFATRQDACDEIGRVCGIHHTMSGCLAVRLGDVAGLDE